MITYSNQYSLILAKRYVNETPDSRIRTKNIYGQLIFHKGTKAQREKSKSLCNKWHWVTWAWAQKWL